MTKYKPKFRKTVTGLEILCMIAFSENETQRELAEHVGTTAATISNIKNARTARPNKAIVAKIAAYFNVAPQVITAHVDKRILNQIIRELHGKPVAA